MGTRKKYKFPQGINKRNRFYYPKSQSENSLFKSENPTNYVLDTFGIDVYSDTDVLGSWTGVPRDYGEMPTQDADDL